MIIDKFEFFPKAALKGLYVDPSLVVDSQFPVLHFFLHEGVIGFGLLEAALEIEHVFNKDFAMPFLS